MKLQDSGSGGWSSIGGWIKKIAEQIKKAQEAKGKKGGGGPVNGDKSKVDGAGLYKTYDTNKDGKVGANEIDAAWKKTAGKKKTIEKGDPGWDQVKQYDLNGNGRVSKEEFRIGVTADGGFDDRDRNKDGVLRRRDKSDKSDKSPKDVMPVIMDKDRNVLPDPDFPTKGDITREDYRKGIAKRYEKTTGRELDPD